jgi:DNA ligase-1
MKPMLACNAVLEKIEFPVYVQPKIDGVRAVHFNDKFTGRSLKPFANKHVATLFDNPEFAGLDGELAVGSATDSNLCRNTTSAVTSIYGNPHYTWYVFDYVPSEWLNETYMTRLDMLCHRVHLLRSLYECVNLSIVHTQKVENLNQLLALEAEFSLAGYEGVIVRNMSSLYKSGRATVTSGQLLRIKRFVDFEFVVEEIIEGEENLNEPQVNELGRQFRSSHQANKVGNGMVGAMIGRLLADVVDTDNSKLFSKGELVKIGAGRMTHIQRTHFWHNPELLKGLICKGKLFPKGIKDKPRFPTFQGFRAPEDM